MLADAVEEFENAEEQKVVETSLSMDMPKGMKEKKLVKKAIPEA